MTEPGAKGERGQVRLQRSRLCLFPAWPASSSHSAPLAGGRTRSVRPAVTPPGGPGPTALPPPPLRSSRRAGPGPDGPCASGAGPPSPAVSVRPAMGEAGPGPGPGPREAQEPEEGEVAAPGGARGGQTGPRGGIRVLKVRREPRPPPLRAARWDGGESAGTPVAPARHDLGVCHGGGRCWCGAHARLSAALQRNAKRAGSRSCQSRSRVGSRERTWLKGDVGRGCVYVYGKDSAAAASSDLRLVLCTVDTQASEICDREGRKNLFLQLHGDLVR